MAVLGRGPWVSTLPPPSVRLSDHRHLNFSPTVHLRARQLSGNTKLILKSSNSRTRGYQHDSVECSGDLNSEVSPDDQNGASDITTGNIENKPAGKRSSLLLKLGILLAVAVVITFVSAGVKPPSPAKSMGNRFLLDGSSSSTFSAPTNSFSFRAFGYSIVLPEYAPGWIYFWLLMAAACGLFISEEALNIWVEGVCISDMIPFYIGKFFGQSGASDDICSKLGIGKEKTMELTRAVKRYGNLIGFVERFSFGVRNPTAFLAGAMGVSPECFFVGVCCGGLVTLPLQFTPKFDVPNNLRLLLPPSHLKSLTEYFKK
ncbi:hypothetical protein OROMI_015505 [Orobanche minor]